MRCPVCNFKSTRVIDSRLATDGMAVRRRRECERTRCGFRFSTVEEIELMDVTVVKRNGRKEPYKREKIENGLRKALEKRPHTDAQFVALVHTMERDIQKVKGGEITSADIGEIVMRRLRDFDTVAYIRFASVYRQFEDVATFEQELRKLEAPKGKAKVE
ncbi:transcriptional repressor NrdR [Patescibacteria group bacterium]|nr:transcriptional repressor NrdR [Patescibacteria group bacterium]